MPKTYRIFLASSNELADDRIAFGDAIQEINDSLLARNKAVHFSLYKWERETASFFERRKQDEYNQNIETCDLFIMLYWSKVGKYTEEEYDFAYQRLVKSGKRSPVVFVYQKNSPLPTTQTDADRQSLIDFNTKVLGRDGQFRESYSLFNELKANIEREINKLFDKGILTYGDPAKLISSKGVAEPSVFLGREDELKAIRERLDRGGRLMLINAEGGIGKTTLAAKYWHESIHQYKHNAWLFCENGIINALKELAPQLNIDLSGLDEAGQLAALKQGLKQVHDDCLLVLDNANATDDIRVFRQEFEGFHWHVLLTSRCAGVLDQSEELHITHLPPPLAKELFERNYREDTPEFSALLDRLLLALHYHTLSIELFSKNMKELGERGGTLADFVKHLETEGLFLGKRSFRIITDYTNNTHLEATNSDEILDRFYNFARLTEPERYYLVNMALLPAEDYDFRFLCDLFGQDTIEFDTLHELARKGWLTKTGPKVKLNPVIQSIALKKNEETLGQDAQSLLDKLNRILEDDSYTLVNISLSKATPYVKPVGHLSKCLIKYPSWDIATYNFRAGIYYSNTGDVVAAQSCYENYGTIYQNLLAINPENLEYKNGLAISYSRLGDIYEQTGDWQNALTNYQEFNRLEKEIYESSPENLSYKNGLAISCSKLGDIYNAKGDWQNALTNYQEYNRFENELYESSPENFEYKNGLAVSYSKLGDIYNAKGEWQNALTNYQEFNRLEKELYESSPENLSYKNGLAISYQNLGNIYNAKGDWQNALTNYQEYNWLKKEIYESSPENLSYKNGLAISYLKLGEIYEQNGDWQNALTNYQEYNRLEKEIYESSPQNLTYKNGLAISYVKLAGVFIAQNDIEVAVTNYLHCCELFREIVVATQNQLVDFVYNFSWTCDRVTDIIKQHELFAIVDKAALKQLRRDGYNAIKPLAEAGILRATRMGIYNDLADEQWYEF